MYYSKTTKRMFKYSLIALFYFLVQTIQKPTFAGTPNSKLFKSYLYSIEYEAIRDDTIPHQEGDTLEVFTSGLDTVYVTYAEEDLDSINENAWTINNPHKQMVIEMHHQNGPVNTGLIGVNLTDFFEPLKGSEGENTNYTYNPSPWDALSALAPQTVRMFSGASAKFMHPLGSYDPIENIYYGGYGYNWKEMISYYDITFGGMNAPEITPGVLDYATIETQLINDCVTGCADWIDDKSMKRFVEFYDKCMDQPTFNPLEPEFDTREEQPLYLNEMLRLILQIESENTGHTVDLIYCVNIESMTASEMLEVIDYIETENLIYTHQVFGVEMGNEVGARFGQTALGFENFEHYWNYINGRDYDLLVGDFSTEDLEDALKDDVEADHDFLNAIKGNSAYYDIKIGLPAENTPACGELYDFFAMPPYDPENEGRVVAATIPVITDPDPGVDDEDCDCFYPDWNVDMVNYYGAQSVYDYYLFDAIVFHPYYSTTNTTPECNINSNWRDIMLQLHPDYSEVSADLAGLELDHDVKYSEPEWSYSTVDSRLGTIFNEITGIPANDLVNGNFKEFTRDRLDITFMEHANQMEFTDADEGPSTKEVWLTEYNLDDKVVLPSGDFKVENEGEFQPYESSVSNTFTHAAMLQNWFLYNIKVNYDPDYSSSFLTRATVQNSLGGSKTMLMTNSSATDMDAIDEVACGDPDITPYFIRRSTYFAVQLWRAIGDNDLKYLRSETTMASLNDNLAPTVFIDDDEFYPKLIVYYTNVTDLAQDYFLDPGDIIEIFDMPGYEAILSTDIDALILDADRLYSTAGTNTLFDVNEEYELCENADDFENIFEITGLEPVTPNISCPGAFTTASPNGVCVRLPAVSMGYFEIPIVLSPERKGESFNNYTIFPNPASNNFAIQQLDFNTNDIQHIEVYIYNMYGNLVSYEIVSEGQNVDVSALPVGAYNIVIKTNAYKTEFETLIKMQ